jgi:energy-coupling factor transporter transmembrane protein EcfT
MDPGFLAKTVAIPAALSTAAVAAAFFHARRIPAGVASPLIAPAAVLAMGLSFVVGGVFIVGGWPDWRPANAHHWLPYLGLLAVVLGLVDAAFPRKAWSLAMTALLLAGFGFALAKGPLASRLDQAGDGSTTLLLGILALVIAPGLAIRLGEKALPNAGPPFALGLLVACSIAAAVLSGSAMYAQFVALIGLGLAPLGVASLLRRPWPIDRGLPVVFACLHAAMWLLTHFFATKDGVWIATILACLAPLGLLVGTLPWVRATPLRAGLAQVIATVAMGAAALGVVLSTTKPATDDQNLKDLYGY